MTFLLLNLALALIWTFLSGDPTLQQFFIGFLLGFVALFPYRREDASHRYIYRTVYVLRFFGLFLYALASSVLQVAWEVITPAHHMKPGVVAVDIVGMSPLAVYLLSTAITLTPGTITLAVSGDRRRLFVHAMYAEDPKAVVQEIETLLKQPILKIFPAEPLPVASGAPQA